MTRSVEELEICVGAYFIGRMSGKEARNWYGATYKVLVVLFLICSAVLFFLLYESF